MYFTYTQGHTTFEGWNLTDVPNSPVGSPEVLQQKALNMLDTMTRAVKEFVADYCESFNMPFMPTWLGSHDQLQDHVSTVKISTLEEPVRIKICCLHRPGVLRSVDVLNTLLVYLFIGIAIVIICIKLRQAYTMEGARWERRKLVLDLE